jgi:hypothetical protein
VGAAQYLAAAIEILVFTDAELSSGARHGRQRKAQKTMNSYPGVLGRKVGMTQIVAADGEVTPVTVVEVKCVVVGKRTAEKNGYDALVLGMDEVQEGGSQAAAHPARVPL